MSGFAAMSEQVIYTFSKRHERPLQLSVYPGWTEELRVCSIVVGFARPKELKAMLDYAPDVIPGNGTTSSGVRQWTVYVGAPDVRSDDSLLLNLVAAVRGAGFITNAVRQRAAYDFHPERTSGFCASS
jgi:hypothetical protein